MTDRAIQLAAYIATAGVVAFGAWCVWVSTAAPDRTGSVRFSLVCGGRGGLLAVVGAVVLCLFGAVLAGLAAALSWRRRRADGRPLGVAVSLGVLSLSAVGTALAALRMYAGAHSASCD
jgi:hypothetical protein